MLASIRKITAYSRVTGSLTSSLAKRKHITQSRNFNSGDGWRKVSGLYGKYSKHPVALAIFVGTITALTIHKAYRKRKLLLPRKPHRFARWDDEYVYIYNPNKHGFMKKHLSIWPRILMLIDQTFGKNWSMDPTIGSYSLYDLDETDYKYISEVLNFEEAITYARQGCDIRLLKSPYDSNAKKEINIIQSLHSMVSDLSHNPINQCLLDQVEISFRHIASSVETVNAQSLVESSGFDAVAGDTIPQRRVSEETVVIICLTAILAHSVVLNQIPDLNVLGYLATLFEKYQKSPECMSLIVKILANLSVDKSSRKPIHDSGCLYIVAHCAKSTNVHLSFPAYRALHNLDREDDSELLLNGIYQMYPEQKYDDEDIDYDIIFVHGLLGSAFKTWRRQELTSIQEDRRTLLTSVLTERLAELGPGNKSYAAAPDGQSFDSFLRKSEMLSKSHIPRKYHNQIVHIPESELTEYCAHWPREGAHPNAEDFYPHISNGIVSKDTMCWPRDWLPLDCPNGRVINVDFESFISKLWPGCPVEQYEDGLKFRSKEMLEKLIAAGVGKRPIVFVCHSMGGLIVKHMIVNSHASKDPKTKSIAEQTKSVFFYSTPHYGSDTGRKWLDKGGKFFVPTKEFEEIAGANESFTDLVNLQEKFSKIYEAYKYKIVSLSELKPSYGPYGVELYLVPRHSSDMGHGENFAILLDHLNICKPFCRHSFVYTKLIAYLQELSPSGVPSGVPSERVRPLFSLDKGVDHDELCAKLGLGSYGMVDPHLVVGKCRGPREVAEWERINRESEVDDQNDDKKK